MHSRSAILRVNVIVQRSKRFEMKLIVSLLVSLAIDLTGAKPAVQYYATKYDHVDVESILNNRRMVNYYSACLLSKGPCPPEGVELKRILPEALQTNCAKCTEKQKTVALRAIKRLKKEYPKVWGELANQWDPNEVFVKRFENTFAPEISSAKPGTEAVITDRFPPDDQHTDNTIDGTFSPVKTTTVDSSTTQNPPQNNKPSQSSPLSSSTLSSTISGSLKTTSTASTTTTSPSTTFSTPASTITTSRPASIPGLIPLNTFFTNPPIPIRPIANLNLGANIEATVQAIKRVEKLVAGIAMEKIGLVRNIFLRPWRKLRKQT